MLKVERRKVCITFCHRSQWLYWNHEDCHPADCAWARGPHEACADCLHRRGQICHLTRAPLPQARRCCHHNVTLIEGPQKVTREMVALLGIAPNETEIAVLVREDVPYQMDDQARAFVDPDRLGLPHTYGIGTDHLGDEVFWPQEPFLESAED